MTIALIVITYLIVCQTIAAGLITHPRAPGLAARERSQETNLYHALYVCKRGRNAVKRWHCKAVVWLRRELDQTRAAIEARNARRLQQSSPTAAIRAVFGPYADQAIRVSSCETGGTFSVNASNGQYLGIFQMGSSERARYGHGPTALEQARAAYRYFIASGRDWSPWSCRSAL